MVYYWIMSGMNFNSSLKRLENDTCVFEMALFGAGKGKINIFMKHLSDEDLQNSVLKENTL